MARGQLKAPGRFPTDPEQQDAEARADTTDEALAAFGLQAESPDDAPAEPDHDIPLHLWRENWPVWCLWRDCDTQWRKGEMGAPSGLDYAGVWTVIGQRFRRRERKTVFWLVQAMEEVTLAEWRDKDGINGA